MLHYFHSRTFLVSFLSTVVVLLLIIGLLMVDAEGRKLSFNDTSPAFEIIYNTDGTADMQINAFSLDSRVNVTGFVKVWHFIADFFCIPHGRFPQPAITEQTGSFFANTEIVRDFLTNILYTGG